MTGRTISLQGQCIRGHAFDIALPSTAPGVCPHGISIEKNAAGEDIAVPQQVDLTCPVCGKGLSVVGEVGTRTCLNPDCIKVHGPVRLLCSLCEASKPEQEPLIVVCPLCGGPVSSIGGAPPITFVGVVNRTIPAGG